MTTIDEPIFSKLICEPHLDIDIVENVDIDQFHELVYRQVDIAAIIGSFNAILLDQDWLNDEEEGFLPITSRRYSKSYLQGIKIKDFKKGSLVLSIFSGVASGIILMIIQETYKKMHPEESKPIIQITNHYENCHITINGDQIELMPYNSILRNSINEDRNRNLFTLDAQKYVDRIIKEVNPNKNLEDNIRRCVDVLREENLIIVPVMYDSKGMRTVVNYAGRVIDYMA